MTKKSDQKKPTSTFKLSATEDAITFQSGSIIEVLKLFKNSEIIEKCQSLYPLIDMKNQVCKVDIGPRNVTITVHMHEVTNIPDPFADKE